MEKKRKPNIKKKNFPGSPVVVSKIALQGAQFRPLVGELRSCMPSGAAKIKENNCWEGNGTPLQYSCLENTTDGGAWWAAVHDVSKSRTRLSDFDFSLSCIGEGNGNPLQCSCLENPSDGGAWWAAVYGVAQSRTRLKRPSSSKCWQGSGKLELTHCCWWEYKVIQSLWKTVWQFLKRLNIVTMWPSISTPRFTPKRIQDICSHKNLRKWSQQHYSQ